MQTSTARANKQNTPHAPAVEKIMDEAMPLLRAQKAAQAEPLFRQALALEPIQPDLLNNLASSLMIQDRDAEGIHIIETVHT